VKHPLLFVAVFVVLESGVIRAQGATGQGTDPAGMTRVEFSKRFVPKAVGDTIVVQTLPEETLVMSGGPYILQGKGLYIGAGHVEINGRVEIRSFDPKKPADPAEGTGDKGPEFTSPPDHLCANNNGCNGSKGHDGGKGDDKKATAGASARVVTLDLDSLTGGGTLVITADGQQGGQGQKGGKGGTGQQAGRGGDRHCGDLSGAGKDSPGDGAIPGPSGNGGIGGRGGSGGTGGSVLLSRTLQQARAAGRILVSINGGTGGLGGDSGDWGEIGAGNEGGSGATCGGGGTGTKTFPSKPAYDANQFRGPVGPSGAKGTVDFFDSTP